MGGSCPDGMPQPLDFVKVYMVWYDTAGKFGGELVLVVFHCNRQIKIH